MALASPFFGLVSTLDAVFICARLTGLLIKPVERQQQNTYQREPKTASVD